jgi:tRNA A-37 threonylcarbamoyl transferase component Bud32
LEELLARVEEVGTPVKVRAYREVWRLPFEGRTVYLKWYPRAGSGAKRAVRGDPAGREYERLQWLQRAGVAAPRAVAYLGGITLKGRKGDGVLTWGLEPGETLDRVVHEGRIGDGRERRALAGELIATVRELVKAGLGHSDLHLGNFLRHEGRLYLLDAYAVHRGGMGAHDLDVLGFAVSGGATRTELLRGWRAFGGEGALPPLAGKVARRHWRKVVERATTETAYAGRVTAGEWRGAYFKGWKFPRPHAPASALSVSAQDWETEWPRLWERVTSGTLGAMKRGPSGEVWGGDVVLGGVPVEVVVKRPFRRYPYRYVTELGRGTRAWRAWRKAWMLTARGIATAWPLAVMERRVGGLAVDQAIVCERVRGRQLDQCELGELDGATRELLFRRVGKVLRRIEETGLVHFDTKASNFMVRVDEERGPEVVLVDVDGVRGYSWRGEGIRRMEASLRRHQPRLVRGDIEALWAGYAPFRRRGAK